MSWPFDPTVYLGLIILALAYGALSRLRADLGPRRRIYFALGLLTIWAALETPIDVVSDHSLQSIHMLQHVLIGLLAPPLLILGLSPSMVRTLLRVPGLRSLTEPVPAQLIFGIVMLAWHVPALYDLTLRSEGVHVFEHLTFMTGGVLFWWPVVGPTSAAARWRLGDAGRALYLLFGTVPSDTVAVILMFAPVPYYDFYIRAPRVGGIDPLTDQLLAGIVLMALGKLSFLVAILEIAYRWVARIRAEESGAVSGA